MVFGCVAGTSFVLWFFAFCLYLCVVLYFFFFSSRRRHTRLQGDWSSDVCSSDLIALATARCRVVSLVAPPRLRLMIFAPALAWIVPPAPLSAGRPAAYSTP